VKVTRREAVLGLAAGVVILFGGTYLGGRSRLQNVVQMRDDCRLLERRIERAKNLVAERERWEAEWKSLESQIPIFQPDQDVSVHWLSVMDKVAGAAGVTISKRQKGEVKKIGRLYELPIDVGNFEGSLDATVRFLFDLQSQNVMMDVRQLLIKPKGPNVLRGRFTLYCAYMTEGAATQ